ncbi:efflux RND transporter permease subunit [Porticoccus sp. W117]|uniref:efflux RND transporter permease subunit n=1 Tax=Porticoccus sp. W117 TaxID=3054777 RepID=UPI0025966F4B|nr:efflux RND transporter permease subunit [Porticoccus sp. W117]MDM3870298.1 efflux RND transporter permease subunit [Porticoccus sp. W117]
MNSAIAWWAKNPVAANLMMVGIVLSGILGYLGMEREIFPTLRVPLVQVTVPWPGAGTQDVEEQIVIRVEEALSDMDNIDRLRSTASEGIGQISVIAKNDVDMAQFVNDIKLRVDSISSFPRNIERPVVREFVTREEMIRIAVHGQVGERQLKRLAEQIRQEMTVLPGVAIVDLFGTRLEEVSIELSEQAMSRYGLTFDDVANAIRSHSINLSSGQVRTATGDLQLRARNLANNQMDFEAIVVRQGASGGTVYLKDVARVIDGFEDNEILATLNGEPAILVQVMTTENMDVVKTSESVNEWLDGAKKRMPQGVGLTLWWDAATLYEDRMNTIIGSAGYGLILVFLVLLLTLRPKVALWVTVGIATAYAGAFALLPANDVSLNILSTFAFLLVLGIVVDDAIVVGESIHQAGKTEPDSSKAAILGTQLVAKPILYAVLTTMIAFMPWFFISGVEAQITRQISIIIVAALSFSLIEAFFILPAHLRKLQPRSHEQQQRNRFTRLQYKVEHSITKLATARYQRWVNSAVKHRYLTASVFFGFFVVSVGLFNTGWVKFSFMPEIESEQIIINVDLPDGTPYSRALEILAQLQNAEKALEQEVNDMAEDNQGELVENWYTRSRRDSVIAIVKLAPPDVRDLSAKQAAERLRELIGEIPDADDITVQYTTNNQDPDLQYSVSHPDLDALRNAVLDLQQHLRSYESAYDVHHDLQSNARELRFTLLPGASKLGLTLADISRQVRQAYYGEEVQRLPRNGNDVKVMVRYPKESRTSLQSLQDFRVRTADGRQVPLLAVAEVEYEQGSKRINRRERRRSAVISARLKGDIRHQIQTDLDDNFFPEWKQRHPGIILGAVGEAEGEQEFIQEVTSLYLVALFLMYALIAVAFRSYWLPLLIMTAIPFGFMGAVFGHLIMGQSMALFSYFGIGAAVGVVVNDNLVLVDYVLRLRAEGKNAIEAVTQAAVKRFRPILLTSLTTFIGLMPMMAERSIQAQFLLPTVISLAFGVAFATFVTLLLVPALYAISDDWLQRLRRLRPKTAVQEPSSSV